MFTSVALLDSKQELLLSNSLWRLSWITFIFLPLTFLAGFFGMNVDTFQPSGGAPSLKWYFISSAALMVTVILVYIYLRKRQFKGQNADVRRSMYESVFHEFSEIRPGLFTRAGPRQYIRVSGPVSWLKWRLITHWFNPDHNQGQRVVSYDDMGTWTRVKRVLARRWLYGITSEDADALVAKGQPDVEGGDPEMSTKHQTTTTSIAAGNDTQAASTTTERRPGPGIDHSDTRARSGRVANGTESESLKIITTEESSDQDSKESNNVEQSNVSEQVSRRTNDQ